MEIHESILLSQKTSTTIVSHAPNGTLDQYDKNTIYLVPSRLAECTSVVELMNALSKRFHNSIIRSIAVCCVCSHGYSINHENIGLLARKDFINIWGHLETLQKSSSPDLSQWLNRYIGNRSQEGYIKSFEDISDATVYVATNRSRNKVRFGTNIIPINTTFSEAVFGSSETMLDAMISDAKMLSALQLAFNKPVLKNDILKPSE